MEASWGAVGRTLAVHAATAADITAAATTVLMAPARAWPRGGIHDQDSLNYALGSLADRERLQDFANLLLSGREDLNLRPSVPKR
ncbi:MAG TPA: hypothetical protein VFE69_10425, partial [Ilumatobacteraceae bacterium]|nr:hypothetical protein [Ilumatobacteraceae bacterium]